MTDPKKLALDLTIDGRPNVKSALGLTWTPSSQPQFQDMHDVLLLSEFHHSAYIGTIGILEYLIFPSGPVDM